MNEYTKQKLKEIEMKEYSWLAILLACIGFVAIVFLAGFSTPL